MEWKKRIFREDEKKDQEEIQETFRHYKNSKFQTWDVSVTLTVPHLFARKANIVCLLFIVSQTCFNKDDFFCC